MLDKVRLGLSVYFNLWNGGDESYAGIRFEYPGRTEIALRG